MAHVWRAEDNFGQSVLSFYHVGLRVQLRSPGLAASKCPSPMALVVTIFLNAK